MKIEFEIKPSQDTDAGFLFLGDTITLSVESGFPGGSPGEFEDHMLDSLKEWYEPYKVRIVSIR